MQNLMLAAQSFVAAQGLGATTSALTFFRSMGGAIGVSALGAVLAGRITTLIAERFGPAAVGAGSTAAVPDVTQLPAATRAIGYGQATAELFLVGAPIAALSVVAVLFIKEKPLPTISGDVRRAQEEAARLVR